MTRIVPQLQNSDKANHTAPDWLDVNALMSAAHTEVEKGRQLITKLASAPVPTKTISYACTGCSKVYSVDSAQLRAQATLASGQSKIVNYICPDCGNQLSPYRKIAGNISLDPIGMYAQQYSTQTELGKTGSSTYNTFADNHFVLKGIQELSKFAAEQGMLMANARYMYGEHLKRAGQDYPVINNMECVIDWVYGRNQKAHVTASIAYDAAGKFIYPKVFKTADGQQHPFEKEYIKAMEKEPHFQQILRTPKKTDMITFRRPDITRFRAFASMDETACKEEYNKYVDRKKEKGKEPKSYEAWMEKQEKKEASLQSQSAASQTSPMGTGTYPNPTPTQAQPNVQYQQGQQVVNPQDGKTYNVKTPSTGTGMVVTDPMTNQDAMIPQNQIPNVKPAVQTQASFKTAEEMSNDLIEEFLKDEIGEEKSEIQQHEQMAQQDADEIQKAKEILDQTGENSDVNNFGSEGDDDDAQLVEKLMSDKFDGEPHVQTDDHSSLLSGNDGGNGYGTGHFFESSKKKVQIVKQANFERVSKMSKNWYTLRDELIAKQQEYREIVNPQVVAVTKPIERMNRQERFARDLGFSPDKTTTDATGHSKVNNLPFAEKKDIEVGLTEFPYEHKKEDSVGYNDNKGYGIPFADMDENFIADHEHFNNENKLPIDRTPREDFKTYESKDKKDQNYGYSEVATTPQDETKFALMEALHMTKTADEIQDPDGPKVLPVQYKKLTRAPNIEGYKEPDVIPEASGKISEAITKFQNAAVEIDKLKKTLAIKLKPLQESIKEISAPIDEELKAKSATLVAYMNMIYDQLRKTESNIAAYEEKIFSAYQRTKLTVPTISLPQVINRAGTIDPKLMEEILKVKAILENESTGEVEERTLYEHPVSEVQKKKISHKVYAEIFDGRVIEMANAVKRLEQLNSEFEDLIKEIQ